MKIHSLYINEYKLLNDFTINFSKDVSILIGINGSGKSTIFEAIAWIFKSLHLTFVEGKVDQPPFEYEISYSVVLNEPRIDYNKSLKLIQVDELILTISSINFDSFPNFIKSNHPNYDIAQLIEIYGIEKLLPNNIVIYYSGLNEVMHFLCQDHDAIYKQNLRIIAKSSNQGFNALKAIPLFYIEKIHFEIFLASLFSFEYNLGLNKFFNDLNIGKPNTSAIGLFVKKRLWKKGENENTFWGASGLIGYFLSLCRDHALSKFHFDPINEKYSFIFNIENWYKLRAEYVEEKKLFYILHMLYASDMLSGLQIFLTRNEIDIDHYHLSEGEKQLITIRGINELLLEDNTLLLFDEPDTYLHPSWQRNFIEGINDFSKTSEYNNSQFLITTHSPQLLSNADPANCDVQIMEDGEIVKVTPKYYGRDISTILYEMMGVERRNKKVAKLLSVLFNTIEDEDLENSKVEYEKLIEILGEDDPAMVRAKSQLDYLQEEQNEANS